MSVLTFLGREERLQAADSPPGAVSGDQGGPRPVPMSCVGKLEVDPLLPEVREEEEPQERVQAVVQEPGEAGGGLVRLCCARPLQETLR